MFNKLFAYIFVEKESDYGVYNAVVLARNEDEAWDFMEAEWSGGQGNVREQLVIAGDPKPLNPGVLDVTWYRE
jgi:hypothetical protein